MEALLDKAEPLLMEAQAKAREARKISNLPVYMLQRLSRLSYTIERRDQMKDAIHVVRKSLPPEALEAERQRGKQNQLAL